MSADKCARRTVEAFVSNQKDVCIAKWYHSAVTYIRALFPSLFVFIMRQKAIADSKIYS